MVGSVWIFRIFGQQVVALTIWYKGCKPAECAIRKIYLEYIKWTKGEVQQQLIFFSYFNFVNKMKLFKKKI